MGAYSVISPQAMVNGEPEDISVVRANFEALSAILNSLDDSNIAPNANIQLSKLQSSGNFGGVSFSNGSISAPGTVISNAGTPGQVALNPGRVAFGLTGLEGSLYLAANNMLKTDGDFVTNGSIYLNNDSARLYFGTNNDASFYRAGGNSITTAGAFSAGAIGSGSYLNVGTDARVAGALSSRVLAGDIGASFEKAATVTINATYHRITVPSGTNVPITNINGAERVGQFLFLYNATGTAQGAGGFPAMFATGGNINIPPASASGTMAADEFRFLIWDGSKWQLNR